MTLRILIYNSGLDKMPPNRNININITNESFNTITTLPVIYKSASIDVCSQQSFVKKYNDIVNTKLTNFVKSNNVDIGIFQELCPSYLQSFNFGQYIAGCYTIKQASNPCPKTLAIGTTSTNTNIQMKIPEFIYSDELPNKIKVKYPHNFFQIVNINDSFNIINLHNRIFSDMSNETNLRFLLHLIGVLIKTNGTPIIICGDNNSKSLPITKIDPESFSTVVDNFIECIQSEEFIKCIYGENPKSTYYWQNKVHAMFSILFDLMAIQKYDLQPFFDLTKKQCGLVPFSINDIIYYSQCNLQLIEPIDLCEFSLKTSSHLPYLFDLTLNLKANPNPLIDRLLPFADQILKISAETDFKIYEQVRGGSQYRHLAKYYKYKLKYLLLKNQS